MLVENWLLFVQDLYNDKISNKIKQEARKIPK